LKTDAVVAVEAPEFKFDHKADLTCFGGVRPWLRKDEEWPRCTKDTCESQLLQFFFQIDFRFVPEEARKFVGDGTLNPRPDIINSFPLLFIY
jgi:hypothetical protein